MRKKRKSKRLVDVLDEEFNGATGEFLKVVTEKFVKLHSRILNTARLPKHNTDLKWCESRIDEIGEGTIPSKQELETANILWRQYK